MTEPTKQDDEVAAAKRRWLHELIMHGSVVGIVSAATLPLTYSWGREAGRELGLREGRTVIQETATESARSATRMVTDQFVQREVERVCKQELAYKQTTSDTQLQMAESACKERISATQRDAYQQGQSAARGVSELRIYFDLFKKKVAAAQGGRSDSDVLRYAEALIITRDEGLKAIGQIANDVLDGRLTDLDAAVKKRDTKRIRELLSQITETMALREAALNRAVDAFRDAR